MVPEGVAKVAKGFRRVAKVARGSKGFERSPQGTLGNPRGPLGTPGVLTLLGGLRPFRPSICLGAQGSPGAPLGAPGDPLAPKPLRGAGGYGAPLAR